MRREKKTKVQFAASCPTEHSSPGGPGRPAPRSRYLPRPRQQAGRCSDRRQEHLPACDAGVGDIGNVEQAVQAPLVDEGSVGHEGANSTLDGLSLLHGFIAGLADSAGLLFENHPTIDNHILVCDFKLCDAAGDFSADQFSSSAASLVPLRLAA